MKERNKNAEPLPTVEEFRKELRLGHKEKVSGYVERGILDKIETRDELEIYREISGMKDMKLIGLVLKKKGGLNPEWFRIANIKYNNNAFICDVFKRYRRAFDWNDEASCNSIFEIAFLADDVNTIKYIIRKKKLKEKYPVLASGSDDMFKLLMKQDFKKWNNDQIVDLYVYAASVPYGKNRIREIYEQGVDPAVVNSEGMTAENVFENQAKASGRNARNKSGELRKNQNQRALKYLHKITLEGKRSKKINPKMIYVPVTAVVGVLIVGIGCYIVKCNGEEYTETDDGSYYDTASYSDALYEALYGTSETSYLTDTSISVAEGDTVNIDYTGYIDGVAFDGGSTDGYGTDLEIGSGTYIDGFEEQLVGHYVGETVSVEVTFPEDYGVDELNGKDAVFEVTINGVY